MDTDNEKDKDIGNGNVFWKGHCLLEGEMDFDNTDFLVGGEDSIGWGQKVITTQINISPPTKKSVLSVHF
jgi:hypothetical protein